MRIWKLALVSDSTHDTIRYYEKIGLIKITTKENNSNNYKDYNDSSVERIKIIKNMKEIWMTLKEIKTVFEAIENKKLNDNFVKKLMLDKLKEVDEKIKNLNNIKILLTQRIKVWCTDKNKNNAEKIL